MMYAHNGQRRALFRKANDFGLESLELVSLPARLGGTGQVLLEAGVDPRTAVQVPGPSDLLTKLPTGANWLATSDRTLASLQAAFLVAEDPQRRLERRSAATLMHQVSLVEHILERPDLKRVLIGDEVGLGKTIEAGLIIKRLVEQAPSLRVLYLAPARLAPNVAREFKTKLGLDARQWVAGLDGDANLRHDRIVVASIHKAVHPAHFETVASSGPWDVVVVDECHHLSDWAAGGGHPNRSFSLVSRLRDTQPANGRLLLMSGTPHQGSPVRFRNLLKLLADDGRDLHGASGRVIFRTKDRVRDWSGQPLFPARDIRPPVVVQLGDAYRRWYEAVGTLYDKPPASRQERAANGWAKGQALQWAASSLQAGLGFLVRLAIRRLGWTLESAPLAEAIGALRPYRGGKVNEPLTKLYGRLCKQVGVAEGQEPLEDEEQDDEKTSWRPDPELLATLLKDGVRLIEEGAAAEKWDAVVRLLEEAGDEKVVLFAQPVETVTLVAGLLEERLGVRPSMIIGNQTEDERAQEVDRFLSDDGPRFLVSSRAGGEGLNMQKARRLIHLDVPWNPMELEQRIGRVHRFGSRRTVIIDTVVAAGCREEKMYAMAREKLHLIARELDPEAFENLFSRVMSLVPPKELESLLGGSELDGADLAAAEEVGRLVRSGFDAWRSFDEAYRKEAEKIVAMRGGEATWRDLADFLVRHGQYERVDGAKSLGFEWQGDEIVDREQPVEALRVSGRLYACGETNGLPVTGPDGAPLATVGVNDDHVRKLFQSLTDPSLTTGAAVLRRPEALAHLPTDAAGRSVVLAFARQSLRPDSGRWADLGFSLHFYALGDAGVAPVALAARPAAECIRALQDCTRVRDPRLEGIHEAVRDAEAAVLRELRTPSQSASGERTWHAVWPVAAVVLVP